MYRRSHHGREPAVFLGDVVFAWYLERISSVRVPLITRASGDPARAPRPGGGVGRQSVGAAGGGGGREEVVREFWQEPLVITDAGREVLAGKISHAALNGVDRWQGGVHLVHGAA